MQAFNLIKGLELFTAKLIQKISSQMPCANTSAILLQTEVSDQTTPVKELENTITLHLSTAVSDC